MQLKLRSEVCPHGLIAIFVLAAMAIPAVAQEAPAIRTIVHFQIKPDKVGDWIAVQKEITALLTKGGSDRGYTVWQTMSGPREFIIVRYVSKWAEFDVVSDPKMTAQAAAMTTLGARASACVENAWREVHSMQPDLTLPRPTEMPKMIRSGRITVAPGKMDEVLATMKSVALPAMKSAGVTSYGVARVRYGAGANQLLSHVGFSSWADLDGPSAIEKGAGRDAYLKYVEKIGTLTTQIEWTVYRFRPELSYTPAAK